MLSQSLQHLVNPRRSTFVAQRALRSFGFWDMTKSRHKKSQEHIRDIQMYQSPVDIKSSNAEYQSGVKLQINYKPIKVTADIQHPGQLILDVEHLGSLEIQTADSPKPLKYIAKEVHFNGPSEHKIDGSRTEMEMQILHEVEAG